MLSAQKTRRDPKLRAGSRKARAGYYDSRKDGPYQRWYWNG